MSSKGRGLEAEARDLLAKALAEGAEAAEVWVSESVGTRLGIEADAVTGGETTRTAGVAFRLLSKGRLGFAFASEPALAESAIHQALKLTVPAPADDFAFAPDAPLPHVTGLHDTHVEDFTAEGGVELAGAMMEAARDVAPDMTLTGGGVAWGVERAALATSNGFLGRFTHTSVSASLSGVLRNGETTTGFDHASACALADVDPEGVGRTAAELALSSRNPIAIDFTGPVSVLLKPDALAGLFDPLFVRAVTGEAVRAGQSVYADKAGERVLPEGWGVVDDLTRSGGLMSAPFDDEGTPAAPVRIVEDGILRAFLADRGEAARTQGAESTGAAVRADRMSGGRTYKAPPAVHGRNVTLTGPRVSLDDLVAGTDRGVLVHDAMGAHTANAASGDFSVNSSTLFVIENGAIAGAAKPAMVSGNLPDALARVQGMADDVKPTGSGFSPAVLYLPTVRLDGLRVTG